MKNLGPWIFLSVTMICLTIMAILGYEQAAVMIAYIIFGAAAIVTLFVSLFKLLFSLL